jgi:hypothetical protein
LVNFASETQRLQRGYAREGWRDGGEGSYRFDRRAYALVEAL